MSESHLVRWSDSEPETAWVPKWNITDADVASANAWLERAVACDHLGSSATLSRSDLESLCRMACSNQTLVSDAREYRELRTLLLVDLGQARTVITWGANPETEIRQPEFYVRLTRRGRMLVTHALPQQYKIVLSKVM